MTFLSNIISKVTTDCDAYGRQILDEIERLKSSSVNIKEDDVWNLVALYRRYRSLASLLRNYFDNQTDDVKKLQTNTKFKDTIGFVFSYMEKSVREQMRQYIDRVEALASGIHQSHGYIENHLKNNLKIDTTHTLMQQWSEKSGYNGIPNIRLLK